MFVNISSFLGTISDGDADGSWLDAEVKVLLDDIMKPTVNR